MPQQAQSAVYVQMEVLQLAGHALVAADLYLLRGHALYKQLEIYQRIIQIKILTL